MLYNVFDSEPTRQTYDYNKHISSLPTEKTILNDEGQEVVISIDNTDYIAKTTCWAKPFQRVTDNKWVYPVCPDSDKTYTTDTYDPSWRPEED